MPKKLSAPHRGVERFETCDAIYFYGRIAETAQLSEACSSSAAKLVILSGATSVGKSSLARAGLVPQLGHEDRCVPEHIDIGQSVADIIPQIRQALHLPEPEDTSVVDQQDLLITQINTEDQGQSASLKHWIHLDGVDALLTEKKWVTPLAHDYLALARFLKKATFGSKLRFLLNVTAHHTKALRAALDLEGCRDIGEFCLPAISDRESLEEVILRPAKEVGQEIDAASVSTLASFLQANPGALPFVTEVLRRSLLSNGTYPNAKDVLETLSTLAAERTQEAAQACGENCLERWLALVDAPEGSNEQISLPLTHFAEDSDALDFTRRLVAMRLLEIKGDDPSSTLVETTFPHRLVENIAALLQPGSTNPTDAAISPNERPALSSLIALVAAVGLAAIAGITSVSYLISTAEQEQTSERPETTDQEISTSMPDSDQLSRDIIKAAPEPTLQNTSPNSAREALAVSEINELAAEKKSPDASSKPFQVEANLTLVTDESEKQATVPLPSPTKPLSNSGGEDIALVPARSKPFNSEITESDEKTPSSSKLSQLTIGEQISVSVVPIPTTTIPDGLLQETNPETEPEPETDPDPALLRRLEELERLASLANDHLAARVVGFSLEPPAASEIDQLGDLAKDLRSLPTGKSDDFERKKMVKVFLDLGSIQQSQDNLPAALKWYREALFLSHDAGDKLANSDAGLPVRLGLLLEDQGDILGAKTAWEMGKSRIITPSSEGMGESSKHDVLTALLGRAHLNAGTYLEAIELFEKVGNRKANEEQIGSILALWGMGKQDEALKALREGHDLDALTREAAAKGTFSSETNALLDALLAALDSPEN